MDAATRPAPPEVADACGLRRGRLILEIEQALVREYPRSTKDVIGDKKQPLLLLWVALPEGGPGAVALTPLAAPEEYRAGENIRWFEGKRLLDQPARLLRGRRFDLRLAENNRTFEPEWRRISGQVGHGVASAAGEAGVTVPSPGILDLALDQLQRLDKDDLILRWSIGADEVLTALGEPAHRKVLRFRLTTARAASSTAAGLPAAELDVLFFWEPEPGCEWPPPAAPASSAR